MLTQSYKRKLLILLAKAYFFGWLHTTVGSSICTHCAQCRRSKRRIVVETTNAVDMARLMCLEEALTVLGKRRWVCRLCWHHSGRLDIKQCSVEYHVISIYDRLAEPVSKNKG